MPSSYEKGRSAEYHVKKLLEEMGYSWIIRSSRSLTPIDLLASNGSEVIAVQVKARKYLSEDERRSLIEWSIRFKAKPMLAFKRRGRWKLEEIK
ncbi:MAG: restriction endonuclease [archaeon]|nr:restriction endonuclease [archaeon]MCP8321629.1 restriction endonuclease [archaeon]